MKAQTRDSRAMPMEVAGKPTTDMGSMTGGARRGSGT
jgi:hypothetical protein